MHYRKEIMLWTLLSLGMYVRLRRKDFVVGKIKIK